MSQVPSSRFEENLSLNATKLQRWADEEERKGDLTSVNE